MTRKQAIAQINATIERLPDEQLETLAELAEAWTQPSAFSTLSPVEKAEINSALDELDRGEGVDWKIVKAGFFAVQSFAPVPACRAGQQVY